MTAAPPTATATTPKARPWQILEGETTSKKPYWEHFRDGVNSIHPSCAAATATPTPADTADPDQTVRIVSYVGARGAREDREREGGRHTRRETRRERERRRGMARGDGRRDRNRRDQERAREEERRQRDRGDRANRERREPKN